ncbi:MAG TPA: D-alanyl-D-alanine carboxypeptidase, partial [Mycobacterium sp.]|nr:D-alanyl-D-alanine carboxypeptidase [Mycobacterium sp.]
MALSRPASCLAAAAFLLAAPVLPAAVPAALAEPNAAPPACPYRVSTPAAVDSSEVP